MEDITMKYYIYISDAKVDMLLPQIPHEIKKRIATEFKFDLKVLSTSRKTEIESEDNRITRLEAVIEFIRQYGNIGSVDQPDDYIEEALPMRWGPLINTGVSHACGVHVEKEFQMVYFGGETEQTIVGLGGSAKHVLGNTGSSNTSSYSLTPYLILYIARELGLRQEESKMSVYNPDVAVRTECLSDSDSWPLDAVKLATRQMEGPKQQLEFVAKRLLSGEASNSKQKVLLATPLYVAMAE